MTPFGWQVSWLPPLGLACGLYLVWDARQSIRSGEFRFGGKAAMPPVSRGQKPRLFWSLVGPYLLAGLAGTVAAVISLVVTIGQIR